MGEDGPPAKARANAGVAYCVAAGVLYGTLVIFGKLAYETGIEPLPLLFLRYGLAALAAWGVLLVVRRSALVLPLGQRAACLGLGLLYAAQSYLYFVGFQGVDAAVTAILFNTFPFHIALLAALFLKEPLTRVIVVALALCVGGVILMAQPGAGSVDPIGWGLILGSAFGYSIYVVLARGVAQRIAPESVAAHVFAGAALGFTGAAIAAGKLPWSASAAAFGYAAALAVLSTLLPILLFLKGLRLIGAAKAGIIGTLEPLTTVALAAVILGSSLTGLQVFGGALILAASVAIHRWGGRVEAEAGPSRE